MDLNCTVERTKLRTAWLTLLLIGLLALPSLAQRESYDSLSGRAEAALAAEDLELAVTLFEKLVGFYPNVSQAHNRLGYVHYLSGNDGRAIYSFRRALALSRSNEEAQHNLILASGRQADSQVRSSRFSEAARVLDELISTYAWHPQVSALLYYRGRLEFFRGQPDEGLKWWRRAAQKAPESGVAAAVSAEGRSAFDDATLRLYRRAIDRVPTEPAFSYLLGRRQLARGQTDRAYDTLKVGLEVARETRLPFPLLSLTAAQAALESGQAPAAREILEEARRQRPDWASIRALLWVAYLENGRETEADQALQETMDLDPRPRIALVGRTREPIVWIGPEGRKELRSPAALTTVAGDGRFELGSETLAYSLGPDEVLTVKAGFDGPLRVVSQARLQATVGQLGQLAPPVVLQDRRGRLYRLADQLLTKPIIILFWRSDDPEATQQLSALGAAASRLGSSTEVVAVHTEPTLQKDALRLYLSQPSNTAQLWGDSKTTEAFRVEAVPAVMVIDQEGRIIEYRDDVVPALAEDLPWLVEDQLLRE